MHSSGGGDRIGSHALPRNGLKFWSSGGKSCLKKRGASLNTNQSVIEKICFSNFNRLVRTMATVFRAVDVISTIEASLQSKRHHQCSDPFTVEESSSAYNFLIKEYQSVNFVKEISELTNNGDVEKKSSLKNLSPFLDTISFLRVERRLSHSEYSFDKRFPILIEKIKPPRLVTN